jgi:hypothetical protein
MIVSQVEFTKMILCVVFRRLEENDDNVEECEVRAVFIEVVGILEEVEQLNGNNIRN